MSLECGCISGGSYWRRASVISLKALQLWKYKGDRFELLFEARFILKPSAIAANCSINAFSSL